MTDPDPDPDPDPAAGQPPGHGSPDDGDPMDLFGTLDMTDLQSLLDAARESDEAAGDPLGEDAVEATLSGAWRVLSPPEMAGLAADGLAPGPGLGYWMGCFRPAEMDDFSLPGAAAACRRLASWAQATELAVVAEVAARTAARDEKVPVGPDRRPARVPDEAAAEVALALRMSQFGATCWTDLAVTLAWRLTGTSAALHDGRIDLSRARLIAEVTSVLDDRGARLAEDKILPDAGSKTLGQLRAALRRAVITVDPQAAERRREEAERKARVGLYGDEEGTATLSGQNLPGVRAAAAMARITALARALKASGAAGGIDLLRAQVFVGLLLGTLPLIPPADDAPPGPPDDGPVDPADDVPPGPPGDAPPDPADDGPGGLHRIEGIGLAVVASGLTVGSIDFDDLDTLPPKKSSQAHPIGAGAFDPDLGDLAELLEPGQKRLEAGGVRRERLGADESAQRVQRCSHVGVEVSVDATRDPRWSFYDGHGHPFLP